MQLISFRKTFMDSKSVVEHLQIVAAKSKGFFVFFLFAISSLVFFLSGLILAIIEFGLQIDRGEGHSFSGLMVSSVILLGFGLLVLFIGSIFLRRPSLPTAPPPPPKENDRLKEFLEDFLINFLSQFTKPKAEKEKGL